MIVYDKKIVGSGIDVLMEDNDNAITIRCSSGLISQIWNELFWGLDNLEDLAQQWDHFKIDISS
uniref:Uncharacterized protein n=1 Tax=viral metagenome TaxID=1070528 RepID=A0A6M3JJB2_9ZZZZ